MVSCSFIPDLRPSELTNPSKRVAWYASIALVVFELLAVIAIIWHGSPSQMREGICESVAEIVKWILDHHMSERGCLRLEGRGMPDGTAMDHAWER